MINFIKYNNLLLEKWLDILSSQRLRSFWYFFNGFSAQKGVANPCLRLPFGVGYYVCLGLTGDANVGSPAVFWPRCNEVSGYQFNCCLPSMRSAFSGVINPKPNLNCENKSFLEKKLVFRVLLTKPINLLRIAWSMTKL